MLDERNNNLGMNDADSSQDDAVVHNKDSELESEIKAVLTTVTDVQISDLRVQVRDGEVILEGSADHRDFIQRATAVVEGVAGVKSVGNNITYSEHQGDARNRKERKLTTRNVDTATGEGMPPPPPEGPPQPAA